MVESTIVPFFQDQSSVCQVFDDKSKKLFMYSVLDQQVAESSDGISIGDLVT